MIYKLSIARRLQLGFGVLVTLFTAIVWWSFIVGHVMNDIRGFGS